MPYIKVTPEKLMEMQSEFSLLERELHSIAETFYSLSHSLDWDLSSRRDFENRSCEIYRELESENRMLSQLKEFMVLVQEKYNQIQFFNFNMNQRTKKYVNPNASSEEIVEKKDEITVNMHSSRTDSGKEKRDIEDQLHSSMNTVIKSVSPLGKIVGELDSVGEGIQYMKSGEWDKATVKLVGVGTKVAGSVSKIVEISKKANMPKIVANSADQTSSVISKLAGMDDFFEGTVGTVAKGSNSAACFGSNLKKAWGKSSKDFTLTEVSTVLSFVSSGVDNYMEWKNGEISEGRAIAETIGEALVDIVTGSLITTVVAAAAVTIIGSAPIFLVGLGTAAISIGLDLIASNFTEGEKSFNEWISDGVIDLVTGAESKKQKEVGSNRNTTKLVEERRSGARASVGNIGSRLMAVS